MDDQQGPPEPMMVKCAGCGMPIRSLWAAGHRGLLPSEYVLMADWLFHPACYDAMLSEHPLDDVPMQPQRR